MRKPRLPDLTPEQKAIAVATYHAAWADDLFDIYRALLHTSENSHEYGDLVQEELKSRRLRITHLRDNMLELTALDPESLPWFKQEHGKNWWECSIRTFGKNRIMLMLWGKAELSFGLSLDIYKGSLAVDLNLFGYRLLVDHFTDLAYNG